MGDGGLDLCIVYYSKTGRTKRVVDYIAEKILSTGLGVRAYFIRPVKEYFDKLLHLNPRIAYETLISKVIDITGDEEIDLEKCAALLIATPIWYGTVPPPIYSFIQRYSGLCRKPVYCLTTSTLKTDYASKLKKELGEKGYRVLDCISLSDLKRDIGEIDGFVSKITARLKISDG